MTRADLIPRRWAYFGGKGNRYTFWRWLGREWKRRLYHGTMQEWMYDH